MTGLRRARYNRRFLGVCAGIARAYGLNVTMVRVGTVILAIAIPGFSVFPTLIVYVLLAAIMPVATDF